MAKRYFPQADSVGEFEGDPLAAQVRQGEHLLGYVIRTTDIAPIPAYSGEPITLLVGLDLQGRIAGLDILKHSEPILVVGISDQDLKHYIDQYQGVSVLERVKLGGAQREGYATFDGITGATITAMVMNATVMKSIKKVAETRGIPVAAGAPAQRFVRCRRSCAASRGSRSADSGATGAGGWVRRRNPSGYRSGATAGGRSPSSVLPLAC